MVLLPSMAFAVAAFPSFADAAEGADTLFSMAVAWVGGWKRCEVYCRPPA